MKRVITVAAIYSLLWIGYAAAMDSASDGNTSHQSHGAMSQTKEEAMDHSSMTHGSSQEAGTFKHAEMVDGIHAEFQVMDLSSMNMSDPEGRSHHVMVSLVKNDNKIEKAVGKIKLIAPSGKEQTADLQDFGNGVFAANFTIDEPGKWGVICLFKDNDGKHTVKFWYPHQTM